jgi:DNA-directed RNA polymerase specialized sigma24 family protein
VDLVRDYSKRQDLLDDLVRSLEQLRKANASDAQTPPERLSVSSDGRSERVWRLSDRMDETAVQQLVEAFNGGTSKQALAERFGISLSSVKRILRKHRSTTA